MKELLRPTYRRVTGIHVDAQPAGNPVHVNDCTVTVAQHWTDASITDLTVFLLKFVVAAVPAVALTFLIYMLTFLAVATASGLLR